MPEKKNYSTNIVRGLEENEKNIDIQDQCELKSIPIDSVRTMPALCEPFVSFYKLDERILRGLCGIYGQAHLLIECAIKFTQ